MCSVLFHPLHVILHIDTFINNEHLIENIVAMPFINKAYSKGLLEYKKPRPVQAIHDPIRQPRMGELISSRVFGSCLSVPLLADLGPRV